LKKENKLQKILVIGCCGAGKSTFSKKLQLILNLEIIHLDQYYHKPNWEEPQQEE
jgi:adenylate kinase family enzyme